MIAVESLKVGTYAVESRIEAMRRSNPAGLPLTRECTGNGTCTIKFAGGCVVIDLNPSRNRPKTIIKIRTAVRWELATMQNDAGPLPNFDRVDWDASVGKPCSISDVKSLINIKCE